MHILGPTKAKEKEERKVKAKEVRRAKAKEKGVKIVVRVPAENLANQANQANLANQAKEAKLPVPKAKIAERLQRTLEVLGVLINPTGLIALEALVGLIRARVANRSSQPKTCAVSI